MAADDVVAEAARWLGLAEDDLRAADAMATMTEFRPRHICWYSQQAAEKAIKAVLVFEQVEFPYSHDLDQLRALVPLGWEIRHPVADLSSLSRWATEGRYPGDEEPSGDEATEALTSAHHVVEGAGRELRGRGVA